MGTWKKRKVDCAEAIEKHGIFTNHEQMSDGQYRFRLASKDGSSYIRTEANVNAGWQNSHHHEKVRETYIVQEGWMVLAQRIDGKRCIQKLYASEVVTTTPFVVHNVYLPANGIIHTVKHGVAAGVDWHKDEDFDNETKCLTEADIDRLAEEQVTDVAEDRGETDVE